MSRRFLLLFMLIIFTAEAALGQDTKYPPQGEQIPGPEKPADSAAWLADIEHWRREHLIRMGYNDSEYLRPELLWTQSSFIQPQMMIEDRYFYDPAEGKYTVERYLDDVEKRYGGIDSVLIWHTYPNIGVDDRNQYDHLRDMPGGLSAVRQMVEDFHRRGVKVFFPVMLWDQGTQDERMPNWEATARLMAETGADGINGDTLGGVPRAFRAASDGIGHPLALEPEGAPPDEALAWNTMTWGYWKYSFIPSISKYKWLEPRHMVNISNRWARNKTDDLQHAFINGVGYESWENIWGIWNEITPRDAEALRRVATLERAFAKLLVSPSWEPHTPTLRYGIFASKFPESRETLWTIVNRNEYDLSGPEIRVPFRPGTRYYDLWHGVELQPEGSGDQATLAFEIEAHGYGAILATNQGLPESIAKLLSRMHELTRTPLHSFSHEWKFLPQQLVEIPPTRATKDAPLGMVRIPAGDFLFEVSGVEIEGENGVGVDQQYPWEGSPRRHHIRKFALKSFYMDRYPVTNAEFKKFLDATRYRPKDDHSFLRDWKEGDFPKGWGKKPVTWVSLEDAHAFAGWAGKRLPHEWEWQYAAQGNDGRLYPWGNSWEPDRVPPPERGRTMRPPTDVDAFPKGGSPFGVMDLEGNVWQWTDEYVDEHTRAAILRGGSSYQPQGSMWYFPPAYKLTEHGKYLLMAPSRDRSRAIGFRCVADAE